MQIIIYTKNVYGNTHIYMKDSKEARAVQALTGKKTLDKGDMINLHLLGITFKQEVETRII